MEAPPDVLAALGDELRRHVDGASDADLAALLADFVVAGDEYRLHVANRLARTLTRTFMAPLTPTWTLDGEDHLRRFLDEGPRRRMIVCNHLSYTDTQLTDSLLALAGRADLADRLVAVAGPKVYTDAWRRMAAIALNTRKTAQSSAVATEQGALSPRELAAVALDTLRDCERLMDEGYVVLLYPEGTRSRSGRLQPFLRAAGRYLQLPDMQVLPMGQTGSEKVFPIGDKTMHRAHVRLAFGPPFDPAGYPGKTGALAEAWTRIQALLPDAYRAPEGQAPIA